MSVLALALSRASTPAAPAAAPAPRTDLDELALVATDLVRRTALWRPHVRFDPTGRTYALVARTPSYEAWLLTWLVGQSTGWHDHGGSAGVFTTVEGTLHERTVDTGGAVVDRLVPTGAQRAFGPAHAHDVEPWGGPAVSLHVYAPALPMMTRYALRAGRLVATGTERAGVGW